jgi:hypothetical protein
MRRDQQPPPKSEENLVHLEEGAGFLAYVTTHIPCGTEKGTDSGARSFIKYTLPQIYPVRVKKDEMGMICSTHGDEKRDAR